MSQPLDGAWAKIARAEEHFASLQSKITAANYGDSMTFRQEFDPDASTIKVTLEGVPELPLEWALVAADALQNLRAALNYVVWELAKWNLAQKGETREPTWKTQFPIHTKPREFNRSMVSDLHPDHAAIIERLQPNGPMFLSQFPENELRILPVEALAARSPLATIARLTNPDKHEALQLALVRSSKTSHGAYEATDCLITNTTLNIHLTLHNGAEWATFDVTPTGPEPEVKVNVKFTPQVEISGWDLRGSALARGLRDRDRRVV